MAMTATSMQTALEMLKIRLNRSASALDEYFTNLLHAEAGKLRDNGIHLHDDMQDIMLLVDMAAWRYNNRDKPGAMPEWLRLLRRERWLADNGKAGENAVG